LNHKCKFSGTLTAKPPRGSWRLDTASNAEEEPNAVAMDKVALLDVLRKAGMAGDVDFLRASLQALAQALIDLEASERIGARPYERTAKRQVYRNGRRLRRWDTRVGRLDLKIPKLRRGSFFPSLLEPRRRAERALLAVVQEAYVHGVSTRKVDELIKALGLEGISKSQVSRICAELDADVERFRTRRIEQPVPYLWLDATYVKVREDGRVQSMALVVAVGVRTDGQREVLGLDLGPSEDGAFWRAFLRDGMGELVSPGLIVTVTDSHVAPPSRVWARCHPSATKRKPQPTCLLTKSSLTKACTPGGALLT